MLVGMGVTGPSPPRARRPTGGRRDARGGCQTKQSPFPGVRPRLEPERVRTVRGIVAPAASTPFPPFLRGRRSRSPAAKSSEGWPCPLGQVLCWARRSQLVLVSSSGATPALGISPSGARPTAGQRERDSGRDQFKVWRCLVRCRCYRSIPIHGDPPAPGSVVIVGIISG